MKVVFVTAGFSSMKNANVKIVNNIVTYMSAKHEIYVVEKQDFDIGYTNPINEKYMRDGVCIFSFMSGVEKKLLNLKRSFGADNSSRVKQIGVLSFHPICCLYLILNYIDKKYLKDTWESNYRYKQIKKFLKTVDADLIVFVTSPNGILKKLPKFKTIKKVWYQVDPYAYNFFYNGSKYIAYEKKVFESVELCITTPIMYEFYKKDIKSPYLDKIVPLEFPVIEERKYQATSNKMGENNINCVFAGRFYREIRNPKFVLDIFSRLSEKNIMLHTYSNGCEEEISKWKEPLKGVFTPHEMVGPEEITEILAQADILVNVNNSIYNQLPSKTLEYISYGLPILNICKSDRCPSLEYMSRYPLVYTVFEDGEVKIEEIEEFIMQNAGKRIPWEKISIIYGDILKDKIVREFSELVDGVLTKQAE